MNNKLSFYLILGVFSFCNSRLPERPLTLSDETCWYYLCDYDLNFQTSCSPSDTVVYHIQNDHTLKILINPKDWSGEFLELDSKLQIVDKGYFIAIDSVNTIVGVVDDVETGTRQTVELEYRIIGNCK